MDWAQWVLLLKQHGPLVGLFLGLVILQSVWINRLLDRNSSIYDAEIKRLAEVQEKLLSHILGTQQSSISVPTIQALKDGVKQLGDKTDNQKSA